MKLILIFAFVNVVASFASSSHFGKKSIMKSIDNHIVSTQSSSSSSTITSLKSTASIIANNDNNNQNDKIIIDSNGKSSIAVSTFNLAKSVIGAGVLSLPSGVAFLADESSSLIPASIVCTIFGIVAAYSFSIIGKVCKETDSKSFMEAWDKTVSPNSAWLITGSITSLCFLASLAYSIILGDSFSSLFKV